MAEKLEEVKQDLEEGIDDIKESVMDVGEKISQQLQNPDELADNAKSAVSDVLEEGKEVVQEIKANLKGETLNSSQYAGQAGYRQEMSEKSKGTATASLVLGILSIILSLFGAGTFIPLVLGIIGIVLGAKARKIEQSSQATAGFICSIVGVCLNVLGLGCLLLAVGGFGLYGFLS